MSDNEYIVDETHVCTIPVNYLTDPWEELPADTQAIGATDRLCVNAHGIRSSTNGNIHL